MHGHDRPRGTWTGKSIEQVFMHPLHTSCIILCIFSPVIYLQTQCLMSNEAHTATLRISQIKINFEQLS